MNFLAHLEVARRSAAGANHALLLGAMLPDLISVTPLKVGPLDAWPAPVAAGITCHRRADEVFHADPRFVRGLAAIREDLTGRGWPRGPARAAAHVSWELLLDGTLLGSAPTRAAYAAALATPASEWTPTSTTHDSSPWRRVVDRFADHGLPSSLDVPVVADRVLGLLERRPRLAVPIAFAPVLGEILATHLPAIVDSADAVIDGTVASVREDRRGNVPRGGIG